jgi:hypothetical protein
MSKKTTSKPRMSKSAARAEGAAKADRARDEANDKARADALARLNAAPAKATKRGTKSARGSKPEGWQNDPLENDAALEAALAKKDAPATPTAATTVAHDAKPAKGGGKNAKAAKGSPKGERGAKGGKNAKAPKAKPAKPAKAKRISALDAAAKVLAESDRPLRAIDMIEVMHARGLWTSPGGKTPEATLYAAIIREITAKGKDARFRKADRGLFLATGKGG